MKLSVIIPVYNEKNTIAEIVKKVRTVELAGAEKEIIIVDDCSTDGTKEILCSLGDLKVFFHEINQGKEAAIRIGLAAATGDYTVIQDADLEYDPNDLALMLKKMQTENLDVLYGSRRLKKDNEQYAGIFYFIGGVVLSWLTNLLYGQKITDEPTCYKMFKTVFLKSLPLQGNRFEFCPEVTALVSLRGVKIQEVPISYFPRNKKDGKKINWLDGVEAVAVLLWYRLRFDKLFKFSRLNNFFEYARKNTYVVYLFALAILNLIIFGFLFGFHPNNDTESFVWTIERFRGLNSPFHPNRYLNPFYPMVGATVLRFVSPAMSIVISNIIYYLGIILLTYGLIRRVFKNKIIAFWTGLAILPAYAMLRYGLTQIQDIGGYFWFLLTVYAGWRWWEEGADGWLYLGGLATGLGMLTKESGSMGAVFVGFLFLFSSKTLKERFYAFLKFSVIPFVVLLVNQYRGRLIGYTSWDWFIWNWRTFYYEFKFYKWAGVNISTYNILWVGILVGLYYLIRYWKTIDRNIRIYFVSVFLPSLSYFGWPIFIARTVFISAWFFVPLAMFGLWRFYESKKAGKTVLAFLLLVMVVPYALQSILGYAHLFPIVEGCKFNLSCSLKVFIQNYGSISRVK